MRPLWGALLLVVIAYVVLATTYWFVCDDAFISYRYAWHWAQGDGVRFNVTRARPVEGYSDFLWVAIAAAGEWLGIAAFRLMPMVSIASGAALLVLVERMGRHFLQAQPMTALLATLLLALSPPYIVWGTSGLEAMPHAFLWTLAFYGLGPSRDLRGPALGAAALLGSMLLRAEGFAWGGGVLLAAGLARWSQGRRPQEGWWRPLVSVAVLYAGYQAWRFGYYGRAFPNTVYAKVDPSLAVFVRGGIYVLGFFVTLVTPLLVVPSFIDGLRTSRAKLILPVAMLALGPMAFATLVGGDFMTFWRLLVPSLPALALLAIPGLESLAAWRPGALVPVAALVAGLGYLPAVDRHLLPGTVRIAFDVRGPWPDLSEFQKWRAMRNSAEMWFVEGVALRDITKPGDTIVLGAIGATGYAAPYVNILDLYGLVTPEVSNRTIKPRDISTPGHDKEVRMGFFYDERPTIFGFRLFRATDLATSLEEAIHMMSRRDPRRDYAPMLQLVPSLSSEGCPVYAGYLRHTPDRDERDARRDAYRVAKAEHLKGDASCETVSSLRGFYERVSAMPVPGRGAPKQAESDPKLDGKEGKEVKDGKGRGKDGKGDRR